MPGEKFHVRLLPEEGNGSGDRVTVEVGLEGFLVHSMGGSCLRKYPLHHISRWSMRNGGGGSDRLVLYTRSPVRPASALQRPTPAHALHGRGVVSGTVA